MPLRRLPCRALIWFFTPLWRVEKGIIVRVMTVCFQSPASAVSSGIRTGTLLTCLCILGASTSFAQSVVGYGVGKKKDFLQSSAATPSSNIILGDPNGAFHFSAYLDGTSLNLYNPAPKLTKPNAAQVNLSGNSTSMEIATSYASKSALDTAYPNGAYSITAGGSTLPISLGTTDAYSTAIPQITNGTWDTQGRLVINATTGGALSFNAFPEYSTGVGALISFNLYAISGAVLGSELDGVESVALSQFPPSDAALTAYTIPAGFLQADRTYYAELSFARIVDLKTSPVGLATFLHTTGFVISTAAAAAVPVITAQPTNQTVTVGANVTLSVTASGNPTPSYQWRKDGVNIAGATFTSYSLNNVQPADAGSYMVVVSNGAGAVSSDPAVLTVNPVPFAPTITLQPVSQVVSETGTVTFTTTASGFPVPTFQWKKGGVIIAGATGSSYMINPVHLADAGNYSVDATNSAGTASSATATLTVNILPVAPTITTQPASQTIWAGSPVSFTVVATSNNSAPTYQWRKGTSAISGATSATYTIAAVSGADVGTYSVVVTNSAGSTTSNDATLSLEVIVAPSNAVISFTVE